MATKRKSSREQLLALVLKHLTEKIRSVENDNAYKSVWVSYLEHGGQYDGPNWHKELLEAEEVLRNDKDSE